MDRPPTRPINRLLIANRGEIAHRILTSAKELGIETFAVYTSGDTLHTKGSAHAIELPSPASYSNITELIGLCKKHSIDTIHPGYGFLSEKEEFSWRCWVEGITVVGPGWDILGKLCPGTGPIRFSGALFFLFRLALPSLPRFSASPPHRRFCPL